MAWAAVEGFNLYRTLLYDGLLAARQDDLFLRLLFAYGLPLIIVGITAGIGYGIGDYPYGGDA